MINADTLAKLRSFHVPGFIAALIEQRESQAYRDLSFEERLSLLIEAEFTRRTSDRITRKLKAAELLTQATIDQVDFSVTRGLSRTRFLELAAGDWLKRAHHLLADILMARSQGTYHKLKTQLAKIHLLVIDEWLREPLAPSHAREFLDLFDDRYRKASCLIISQLPVADWHSQIQDPTLADAILDRIVHDSLRVELTGESMRKRTSPLAPEQKEPSLRSACS